MRNINGEVLGNLFRSTQQLAAFEQFLAQIAMMQQQQGNGIQIQDGNLVIQQPQARPAPEPEPEKPKPHNPGADGPKLIFPGMVPQKKPLANVGRNDSCPCGSGKKFKNCCGRTA